jgi:hypothetical protein
MEPSEPRSTSAEPNAARDFLPDDAIVAYLRARAPGMPIARFDARTVTSRARAALRRRRRLRTSVVAMAAGALAYLVLAAAGPLPVPGLGMVTVPGGGAVHAALVRLVPGAPPGPDQWGTDVDRLETDVLPVVEDLKLDYYLLEPGPCRILEYPRGNFRDGDPSCQDLVPFDAQARVDFDRVIDGVRRSGVPIERIFRHDGAIYIQLDDNSWQYNWQYVYLPDGGSPPATMWPEERWTHIRGDWWFHRDHDD